MTAADCRRGRSRRPQHLPHPRKGRREGLFGHRPADEARATAREPMIAVAGCVAQAEGPEIAAAGAGRRHRRRPAGLSPPARAGRPGCRRRARARHRHAGPLEVRSASRPPPAGAERLPHRPGRLRQILHLLRRPLHARRRGLARPGPRSSTRPEHWSTAARARSPCSARTSTPGRARTIRAGAQGLDGLIRALDRLPGLERIRYTTSHPNDMTEGLIRAHAEVDKLMPFLHLPVQSGSDRDAQGDEPQPRHRLPIWR